MYYESYFYIGKGQIVRKTVVNCWSDFNLRRFFLKSIGSFPVSHIQYGFRTFKKRSYLFILKLWPVTCESSGVVGVRGRRWSLIIKVTRFTFLYHKKYVFRDEHRDQNFLWVLYEITDLFPEKIDNFLIFKFWTKLM